MQYFATYPISWMKKSKTPIYEVGQQVLVRYRTRNNNRVPNKAWALLVAFNPPGDGNCQFAAISHQLQRLGISRSAETLRREVITYLGQTSRLGSADNRVLWSNMIIESRSDYLLRMARDTEFGDQITLQAISDMFNVQIVIVFKPRDYFIKARWK
ncbi:unnamed protein product [Mytilus coruscus]|uniref:OTU domain-containing protein n=1 Tax=Mytilus coruscus TaxID=42192 RepID=A0A6J8DL07_MYTCO|nr:unnamed protein product [Mytilus coruscus]